MSLLKPLFEDKKSVLINIILIDDQINGKSKSADDNYNYLFAGEGLFFLFEFLPEPFPLLLLL